MAITGVRGGGGEDQCGHLKGACWGDEGGGGQLMCAILQWICVSMYWCWWCVHGLVLVCWWSVHVPNTQGPCPPNPHQP